LYLNESPAKVSGKRVDNYAVSRPWKKSNAVWGKIEGAQSVKKENGGAVKKVPFFKFTSYGNNFLIVDETQASYLSEIEKTKFACQATNLNFGIGADGVIFLQPCLPPILGKIHEARKYWNHPRHFPDVDLIFRLFEPNGAESFSCGNGLMCVARYLHDRFDILSKRILTQVPTRQPKAISIGTDPAQGNSWANMGRPHRVPKRVAQHSKTKRFNRDIDLLDGLTITFREHDLHPFSRDHALKLTGYLVYTGEPHLVIFVEAGLSIPSLKTPMFCSSSKAVDGVVKAERRSAFGTWLIHHIGTYLNKHYHTAFPQGINVDFVKMPVDDKVLEYRCFERGINQETLACGTGALAVAFVARKLNLIEADKITVWPHRCRWYDADAAIMVEQKKEGWMITGKPVILMKGDFYLNEKDRSGSRAENLNEIHKETLGEKINELIV
jgi:diaminopimelate epimerase